MCDGVGICTTTSMQMAGRTVQCRHTAERTTRKGRGNNTVLSTCSLHTNSGRVKESRILIGPWRPAKAPLVRKYLEIYWPCAGGLSAMNNIETHSRDPINSGLTRWRIYMYVCMYVCMCDHHIYSRVWINRLRLPILLVVT